MESKKINQLATELAPELSDLTIIGDPTTGISKKITLSQMASLFTGTVEEYASVSAFPLVGAADTIYIAIDTNVLYRWDTGTNTYVELSPNIINSLVFNDANGFDGTISLVGSVATLTITTALTTGSVGFIGASGALTQDNDNFYWDNSNKRLGIGTKLPTTAIDVFGSGIIGRLNGTLTNNAFLGFASAGTNKWSIGNVQSDHRFRIYNEATTSELVSVLQTGEFGIGIANPTTKLHIDGGASALIANLDANVSVAKSLSFRSDNSNRINLEVSGTESGSNSGANFFLRTYTDAGALIETPLSIVRSTGVTTIKSLTLTNALSVANGGTGSTTQNFVDLTTTQSIGGAKTFTSAATFSSSVTASGKIYTSASVADNIVEVINGDTTNGYGLYVRGGGTASGRYVARFKNGADSDVMWIGNTGNVGIGTTPATWSSGTTLEIGSVGNLALHNSSAIGNLIAFNTYYNGAWYYKGTNVALGYVQDSEGHKFYYNGSGSANTTFTPTERMRITSGGNWLLGKTNDGFANQGNWFKANGETYNTIINSVNTLHVYDQTNSIFRFYVTGGGTINAANTTISAISDIRLKENITDLQIGLDAIMALKPRQFDWKKESGNFGKNIRGFIAQEFEEVFPDLIDKSINAAPEGEEPYKQIRQDLLPILVKGMQQQQKQIEELKALIADK